LITQHRHELAREQARTRRYRELLAQHGVPVPDESDPRTRWDADEHFLGCREIVLLAYEVYEAGGEGIDALAACLERFRDRLGTAKELIDRW
jgi:hypothetical protein